jgi:hypothetical protein
MSVKRTVQILSLLGLAAGCYQIYSVTSPRPAEAASSSRGAVFAGFPQDQTRRIAFEMDEGAFADLTPREQQQQMRDWLLVAVLSDAGLSADEVRQALFELPPLRRGYLDPIANYDYGDTRSRCIDEEGRVVALVPKGSPEQEAESLAHVADEQRKDLGKTPKSFLVFEYELRPDEQAGFITRRQTRDGQELFTEKFGYAQKVVTSAADLKGFLTQVDDLTFVKLEASGVTLGGRKLREKPARPFRVEDAAALWQSETAIRKARQEYEAFQARWDSKTYSTEMEKELLESELKIELEELQERLGRELADGSGFSLDPTYNYEKLAEFFRGIAPRMKSAIAEAGGESAVSEDEIEEAIAALEKRDEVPFLQVLDKLSRSPQTAILGQVLNEVQRKFRFQAARYDGNLSGTEVGMVLFYTDLLAKLWALDYLNSAPKEIADFVPLLKVPISPIYLQEVVELPGTRVWFGPRDRGFQVLSAGAGVLFARNATRIFAASSNPLRPGEEAEPNAASAAFLGWWDNHYEEVARFEPQYQRLNEIMKWSLVISRLADQDQMERLAFLADQKVDHSQWFPDWVRKQPDLRFHDWSGVEFLNPPPSLYRGVETEAIPILYSEPFAKMGGEHVLSGGVSLGSKKVFESRIPIPDETSLLLRRSNVDWRVAEDLIEGGGYRLKTLGKAEFEFGELRAGRASVVAKAKEGAKLRAADLELSNLPIEVDYRATSTGLRIDARAGDTGVGSLSVAARKNGFAVGFESLDLEQAGGLSRRVVHSIVEGTDPLRVLSADRRVAAVIRTPAQEGYLVQMKGSGRWLRLAPEGEPSAAIASDVQLRVGEWRLGKSETPRWEAAWVDDAGLPPQLGDGEFLVLDAPRRGGGGVTMEVTNRGPPPAAGKLELSRGKVRVYARRDVKNTERYYFERKSLPAEFQKDPGRLRELVGGQGPDLDGSFARLRRGDYEKVGNDLILDPATFKKQLEQLRIAKLREAKRLATEGKPAEADRIVESLIEIYGEDPQLSMTQALFRLGEGKAARAAEAIDDALPALRDAEPALAGIDTRLRQPGVPETEQLDLLHLGRTLELEQAARNPALGIGDVRTALGPDGRLDFQARLLKSVRGREVQVSEIRSDKLFFDVDDPALYNNDGPISLSSIQDPAVSRRLHIEEIPNWEIAHAQPGFLEQAATGRRYRLGSRTGVQALGKLSQYPSFRKEPCSGAADRQQRPDCDPFIYLVTSRPLPAAGAAAAR